MTRRLVVALLFAAGCDSPPDQIPAPRDRAGVLTYAIGDELREIGFSETRCTPEPGGILLVELLHDRVVEGPQGEPQRPRVLIARFDEARVVEAHAFTPDVEHEGRIYPILHMVGGDCRREGGLVACNDSTIVGWLGTGRPLASFKAPVTCADGRSTSP